MIQEPSLSTPPTDHTHAYQNKSDIACKGLTVAGASLLASEITIAGDGREGLFTTGGSNVGVVLNPRGGAADGSDQRVMTVNKPGIVVVVVVVVVVVCCCLLLLLQTMHCFVHVLKW